METAPNRAGVTRRDNAGLAQWNDLPPNRFSPIPAPRRGLLFRTYSHSIVPGGFEVTS